MHAIPSYIIDVNASFGKRVDLDDRYTLAALDEELDRHRVALAFGYSQQGVHYNPIAGDDETIVAARLDPRLLPVGVINPKIGPPALSEIDRCLQAGVRAFRIFPGVQGWSIDGNFFRGILERLQGCNAVLMVSSLDSPTGWELPHRIAHLTAPLGIPVLLTDTTYGNQTEVSAVMQAYPHVHAETSWVATADGLDIFVEEVGAGRLLYGSAAPAHPMQKAINQVLEADISNDDKRAILGGNAQRLFGIAPDRLADRPTIDSLEPAQFEEEIIDVHSHLGYWALPMRNADYDPTDMLARMRRFGISRSVLSTYESMRYDVAAGNARLAHAIEGHPQLIGYVELNPYDLPQACAEMDRYYALPNFDGCEVELSHIPCPTGSPQVRALVAEIARRGKPVLFMPHSAGDAAIERQLALDNPELKLIHAHAFDADWARVVQDAPNVHVEFNRSRASHHDGRDAIDILGPERVLFGSDQTLLSVGAAVGLYLDMRMTPDERRLVLSENAKRLFGLR